MVFSMHVVKGRLVEFLFTYFLLVVVTHIFFSDCLCNGSDTIFRGQSLLPYQTIISKEGKFELGFFAPGNSSNYYLGIWYKSIPVQTIVWVANRNNPIDYSLYGMQLVMSSDGYLYLASYVYSPMQTFWGPNVTSNATEGVILDTGNFVLRNASGIIWQSFDHPTDTWLPGGKVGFRWFTDIEVKLVSWRNPDDPDFGNFSLGMNPKGGSELSIRDNDSQKLWSSGPWKGGTFASLSDSSNFSNSYEFTYVSRDGNVYLTYNVYNESVMSRIVIDCLGQMIHFVWSETRKAWVVLMARPDSCNAYAMCGPNTICNMDYSPACRCLDGFVPKFQKDWDLSNFSSGCTRMRPLQCAQDKTGFMKVTTARLPANPASLEVRNDVCKYACLNDCSCNAYAYNRGGECVLYLGDLLDVDSPPNNSTGEDLFVKVDSRDIAARPGEASGKRKIPPVTLVVPITAAILVSCFCFCCLWRTRKGKEFRGTHQNLLLLDLNSNEPTHSKRTSVGNSHEEEINNQHELPIFSFSSIAASTNNFSITNKLGEGGFGPVYKGELLNKQFVAVKRLSTKSGQGLEEFRNETELIAKLQHRNLVRILGCCIENDEKILVYEYMPNKSLDFFLFEPTRKEVLDWKKRFHIAEGIAQGLLYLHHYSRLRIVHRDLKASNILLDAEMNPKISDFGMARIFGGNDTQANTQRIVGTYGYMSPEYALEGRFSVKSDVFAFGVLMLEIISGKKNTGFYGSDYLSLLGYAWNVWKHERVLELIDPVLEIRDTASTSSIPLRYIQIGLLCVQENPADRPRMSDVVAMLNNEETALASPKNPAFTVGRTLAEAQASATQCNAEICSINNLTVSHVEAR